MEPNAKRVKTREVWPWNVLTRHMDALLRDYNAIIRKDKSRKVSISDVYENELYTPFEDWAEMQMVHDDIHNGQFWQILGLTNNTDETRAGCKIRNHIHRYNDPSRSPRGALTVKS